MLTAKQFEAIGRLTIAFNEVENVFEAYIARLIGAQERGVSLLLAGEGTFRHKAARFRAILERLPEDHSDLVYVQIRAVLQLVRQAEELAIERNKYVHASITYDIAKNETTLLSRERTISCDEKAICEVAAKAWAIVGELHEECGELLMLLGRETPLPGGRGGGEGG